MNLAQMCDDFIKTKTDSLDQRTKLLLDLTSPEGDAAFINYWRARWMRMKIYEFKDLLEGALCELDQQSCPSLIKAINMAIGDKEEDS